MQRYLLKIAYDGTNYHGWQVQQNAVSVQFVLQNAMEKLLLVRPNLTGCSRTDAGVHAREFYCHFDLSKIIPCEGIVKGLNSVLSEDIRVNDCKMVESDFHSRYSAKAKEYIYTIDNSLICSPFNSKYVYHYSGEINKNNMQLFCNKIVGEHDFVGFSSAKRSTEDTVRTIYSCNVISDGNLIKIKIVGNGFLYNMVRIIAGTALGFATGRFNIDQAEEIINSKDRSLAGNTLPAKGLILNKVYYTGELNDAQL